jgi:glycine/D-amino acid oxidase-like deaminating enzyme/nitrite reductase/ring-hydroxylating ferredoxin subunit
MKSSEHTRSLWKATFDMPEYPPLAGDAQAEVCVIGAGIAGLSVAYELVRANRSVIVVDKNAVGGGETAQTTAHLSSALDDRYFMLERLHGPEAARLAYESHDRAIARIGEIASEEAIDCDYLALDGYLFPVNGDEDDVLREELAAAHRAGFRDVELVASVPGLGAAAALRFPRQAQFHPLRYVAGLAAAVTRRGGRIHTGTSAEAIHQGKIKTSGGVVTCSRVVVATNTPINDRLAIHSKQAPYRTFAIALRLPEDALPAALWWDTGDPYHYVRTQNGDDSRYLIVGGEDHKTGTADDADDRWRRLEAWTRDRFPAAAEVAHRWSGQVLEPYDGVAYIGANPGGPSGVYIATGDSGHGMTHGAIAGLLLSDLIDGRDNAWAALYEPSRKNLRAVDEYARANLDVARHLAADHLRGGDVARHDDIAPGHRALMREGLRKVAAYRADDGALTICSATCPHLGCIVHWNSAEKSWDCPCHGSRFAPSGALLNGPANRGLEVLRVEPAGATSADPP